MTYFKTTMSQNVFAFAFICLCSCYDEGWANYFDFNKVPEHCRSDSCVDVETEYGNRNPTCDCDESCSVYGTCCFDSSYINLKPIKLPGKREQCSKVQGSISLGAIMINRCNPRWRGSRVIRELCERIDSSDRDPLATIPVTNFFSKFTYRNFFCSLCNFNHRGIILWNVSLTFSQAHAIQGLSKLDENQAERENILRRLEYSAKDRRWGIWNTRDDNFMEFVPVTVSATIPSTVESIVKTCDPSLESKCAVMWRDAAVERMCQSYILPITYPVRDGTTTRQVKFRNPHCAICNYVTAFEEASCPRTVAGPNLSFTLLLDVNPSDGDTVGETSSCPQNEVYDPFFKKCRALVCALPGYVVKNGQCQKS